jgi:hypothetical protein
MSNVLKVSLQTTIYSLAQRGWSQRRATPMIGPRTKAITTRPNKDLKSFTAPVPWFTGFSIGSTSHELAKCLPLGNPLSKSLQRVAFGLRPSVGSFSRGETPEGFPAGQTN